MPVFDPLGGRKYLNDNERRAYLKAIGAETDEARKAFLETLFYTGCRISEGLNLLVGRVDIQAKAVVFETLKRRKRGIFRLVPVPEALATALGNLVYGKPPEARIWEFSRPTAYRMIKAKMHAASIVGGMAMPKGLRHGHGVACASRNVPLPTIQRWMGHALLKTTAIYLDVRGEEERRFAERVW